MLNLFKSLNLFWKLIIGLVLVFILFWATDRFHGGMSALRKWRYEKSEAQSMQQVKELQDANEKIRQENAKLLGEIEEKKKQLFDAEAKNVIYENKDQQLSGEIVQEQVKTERILKELDREESITQQPVSARERCERFRTKALGLGIKDAALIDCNTAG